MLEHALDALRFGPVIPLCAKRKPLVGFARAALTLDDVHALWSEFWPVPGVGVLTVHRYCVLDVESIAKHGRDGFATIDRLQLEIGELPPTREHSTKTGGAHLVYALPPGSPIRSAQEMIRSYGPAPGLDVVAGNAVMRWIGTPGYALHADRPIADMPAEWLAALEDPPVERQAERKLDGEGRDRKYAIAALRGEGVEVAQCGAQRNVRLTKAAFKLGRLSPPLAYGEVESVLLAACEVNGSLREHGRRACVGTIMRSWRAGSAKPMRLVG